MYKHNRINHSEKPKHKYTESASTRSWGTSWLRASPNSKETPVGANNFFGIKIGQNSKHVQMLDIKFQGSVDQRKQLKVAFFYLATVNIAPAGI